MNKPVRPKDLAQNIDPRDLRGRLYNQVSRLLGQLEVDEGKVTLKERVAALVAIGRLQVIFMGLRKEKTHDSSAGASVRKYQAAFTAHDTRRRKAIAGPEPEPAPGPDPESVIDDIWEDDEPDTTE